MQFVYAPEVKAQPALQRADPTLAIELLRATVPYELGAAARLFPVYVRGLAYLVHVKGRRPPKSSRKSSSIGKLFKTH